jgi:hypothetical protein
MSSTPKRLPLLVGIVLIAIVGFHFLLMVAVVFYGKEQFRQLFLYSNLLFSLGMLVNLYYLLRGRRQDLQDN